MLGYLEAEVFFETFNEYLRLFKALKTSFQTFQDLVETLHQFFIYQLWTQGF